MLEIMAEGWWCTGCEFFEMEDEVDTTTDTCTSCGCEGGKHRPVEVVTTA